ncbi:MULTISPECIES: MFS transporter [Bacillus cereus group]|uniref:MFS transporter n=1 Tax=Bacillus cereus TaxID=1396 RepID=A0A2B1DLV5_BACCE|nr:MFS transporter [Bacillus cereus]PDY83132.1 MFS transporter [Bacillus cereus]PFA12676.1 MFS transporter [Bacillus cereus]PFM39936.1 MFS transporter [Bacillus cereus]PGL57567.1 MFS transporter [Bacillus cereus]PGQ07864.1 MFS transporter [Bacillus cereus]
MTYIQKGTKTYTNASIALFLGGFVTFASLYATQPLLPILAKDFGISAPAASITLSITTGIMAIMMLIVATISDVIGRKRIMVVSMFLTSIIGVLTAFSPSFTMLVLLRGALGLCIAGLPSIAMTYIGEEFEPSGLGKVMGLYICGNAIGGMTGRIFIGIVTDISSWRIALGLLGIITVICSILFCRTLPNPLNSKKQTVNFQSMWNAYAVHFKNKQLVATISLGFTLMGSFVTLYNYIGFLLEEPPYSLSQTFIGFLFIVYLMGTFSSVFMGKQADLHGRSFTLMVSITIMMIGAIVTLVPNLIIKIIGLSIFTFGFFGSHSIASASIEKYAEVNKAQAAALYLLFYYLGSSFIGAFSGYFWEHFHWIGIISLIVMLLIGGLSLVLLAQKEYHIQHKS